MTVRYDLTLEGGEDTPFSYTWTTDLTGYTAKLQVRQFSNGALVLEKTSGSGAITLGGALKTIACTFSVADKVTLYGAIKTKRQLHWDLVVTSSGGVVTKVLKGYVTVQDPPITV